MNDLTPVASASAGPEIIVFDGGASRGDIVFDLSQRIPQNEYGLPQFFFRSDLLPPGGAHVTDEDIDAAAVGLFYYEGYPTLESGSAFWNQLPHEPQSRFELFQAYLDQAAEVGIRQLDLLASSRGVGLSDVGEAAKEFYWTSRARAFDLFIVAAEAKKRAHRIRGMENTHYEKAQGLFNALMGRFAGEFEDWISELNAKEAIEVMSELVKIQRMSVGLTGQASSSNRADISGDAAAPDIIRKLAQQGAGGGASGGESQMALLEALLGDGENGAVLQAAIIKMTAPNNRTSFTGEE